MTRWRSRVRVPSCPLFESEQRFFLTLRSYAAKRRVPDEMQCGHPQRGHRRDSTHADADAELPETICNDDSCYSQRKRVPHSARSRIERSEAPHWRGHLRITPAPVAGETAAPQRSSTRRTAARKNWMRGDSIRVASVQSEFETSP